MITYHRDMTQKTEQWIEARRGLITASAFNLLMTPTGKTANNDKTRQHLYDLAAQRITSYVEPQFVSNHMQRGELYEDEAVRLYDMEVARVDLCGIITNDDFGFTLGYSPDGLVGDDGLIEVKSRMQKFQVQTIVEHVAIDGATVPAEFMLQLQAGLLISGRKWIDFLSICGGLPMIPIRVYPDPEMQARIIDAATEAEQKIKAIIEKFHDAIEQSGTVIETERLNEDMMI